MTLDLDSLERALSPRTKLVACTLASNAVGTIPPVAEVVARAKAAGALVALDGVHVAQHRSIDLHALGRRHRRDLAVQVLRTAQGMPGRSRRICSPRSSRTSCARRPTWTPSRWETGTQSHEALAGTIARDRLHRRSWAAVHRPARRDRRTGCRRSPATSETLARGSSTACRDRRRPAASASPTRAARRAHADLRHARGRPAPARDEPRRSRDRGIFTWDGHYYAIEVFDRLGLLESGRGRTHRLLPLPHARGGRSGAGGPGRPRGMSAGAAPGTIEGISPCRRKGLRCASSILGGDGYLGWPTAMRFSNLGHDVHVLDNYLRRRAHEQAGTDSLTPIDRRPPGARRRRGATLTGRDDRRHRGRPLRLGGRRAACSAGSARRRSSTTARCRAPRTR